MTDRVICSVAQLEPFVPGTDEPDCEHCKLHVISVTYDKDNLGVYSAKVIYGGGSLAGYQFDDDEYVALGPEFADSFYDISYPAKGFNHLCVQYNREGGARINVVAADIASKKKIRPKKIPADGHDAACPISMVTVDGNEYPLSGFPWDANQQTDAYEQGDLRGGFSAQPPSQPGIMEITAKDTLTESALYSYEFHHWERNRLSSWVAGTDHQWIEESPTISFDQDSYQGLIAYYKRVEHKAHWHEPQTLPQPIDYGYPEPLRQIFSAIRSWILRIFGGGQG